MITIPKLKLPNMKKILISLSIILLPSSFLNAQFTGLGGGTGFTTGYHFHDAPYDYNKSGNFFGSVKGIYELDLPLHISPSITFFIPHIDKQPDTKTTVSTLMFDINGHYVFNSLNRMEFYGLAGIDILLAWKKTKYTSFTEKESDNALGLNLGAGTNIKITEQLYIYAEAKYILSRLDQFLINAGVMINIGWLSKHEEDNKL